MRVRPVVLLLAGAFSAVVCRRVLSRMAGAALIGSLSRFGYAPSPTRRERVHRDLLGLRSAGAEHHRTGGRRLRERLLARIKSRYDQYLAGERPSPPMLNVLVISGGGDRGALGAGFLKGWQTVPATHPLAMPEFDIVTGVSTGTLIAPFAFLSDAASIAQINYLYRNPQPDWVRQRGLLYFLPDNISFAEVPGLEREIRKQLTLDLVRRIAEAGADGRVLVVNTTNLDDASARIFDLVQEAERAVESGDLERIHTTMLASAGIPGAFPFRIIDHELYVDGGITGNILYGGRVAEEHTCRPSGSIPTRASRSRRCDSGCSSTTSSIRCRR